MALLTNAEELEKHGKWTKMDPKTISSIKINSKWHKDLNIRLDMINHLQENRQNIL